MSLLERLIQLRKTENSGERSFLPIHDRIVDIVKVDDFWLAESMETAPSLSFFGDVSNRPPTPHFLVTERQAREHASNVMEEAPGPSGDQSFSKADGDTKRRRLS